MWFPDVPPCWFLFRAGHVRAENSSDLPAADTLLVKPGRLILAITWDILCLMINMTVYQLINLTSEVLLASSKDGSLFFLSQCCRRSRRGWVAGKSPTDYGRHWQGSGWAEPSWFAWSRTFLVWLEPLVIFLSQWIDSSDMFPLPVTVVDEPTPERSPLLTPVCKWTFQLWQLSSCVDCNYFRK